jgi:hypothetical protein
MCLVGRAAAGEPALDIRAKPAPSTAGTLRWKRAGAHPTVDRAAVPAGDLLDIPRAEHLVDTGDSYRRSTRRTLAADRHEPARAPDVYTSPFESTTLYRRDRTHARQSVKICSEHDRSVDEATGHERFDMTPPPDLPPPPQ